MISKEIAQMIVDGIKSHIAEGGLDLGGLDLGGIAENIEGALENSPLGGLFGKK